MSIDLNGIAGLGVRDAGQVTLSGEILELERRLERVFLGWAVHWGACEYRYPALISAAHLHRLDYFESFPHLATFPVTLDRDAGNLERFAHSGTPRDGEVRLTEVEMVRHVLTPAACYHVYVDLEDQQLAAARYITTRATCFRREERYEPLERQWSFSMREVVCIGTEREVEIFLEEARAMVTSFAARIGLPIGWESASDPFFNPKQNCRYIFQKLEPVKQEMVFEGRLALGSTNLHRTHFGEIFGITRDGQPAWSGCVAFGLERWIYAFLSHFGPTAADWPTLEATDA